MISSIFKQTPRLTQLKFIRKAKKKIAPKQTYGYAAPPTSPFFCQGTCSRMRLPPVVLLFPNARAADRCGKKSRALSWRYNALFIQRVSFLSGNFLLSFPLAILIPTNQFLHQTRRQRGRASSHGYLLPASGSPNLLRADGRPIAFPPFRTGRRQQQTRRRRCRRPRFPRSRAPRRAFSDCRPARAG